MIEEPPRLRHNRTLASEYIAKSGIVARFPPVSEQAESVPLDCSQLPKFSYNPSIYQASDKTWMTYRHHHEGDYRTRLEIARITDGTATNPVELPLTGYSLEDARLFQFRGEMWVSWVVSNFEHASHMVSVVKYARVESNLSIDRIYQVKVGSNDGSALQKNWCFFESDENLFCVYLSFPEHTVLQIQGDEIVNEYKTAACEWPYGEIHGGNIVPHNGRLLRFFHSRTKTGMEKPEPRYFVGVCALEPRPPFAVSAINRKPLLCGSELPQKDCFHFKPNVVFPCGAVLDGNGVMLSVGINDCGCELVRFKFDDLNL